MITFVIFAFFSSTWLCTLNIGQLLTLYKSLSLLVSEQRRERADAAEESQHRAAHLAPQLLLPITHTNQRPASPSKQTQEIKDKFQYTENFLCWSPYPSLWPERGPKEVFLDETVHGGELLCSRAAYWEPVSRICHLHLLALTLVLKQHFFAFTWQQSHCLGFLEWRGTGQAQFTVHT